MDKPLPGVPTPTSIRRPPAQVSAASLMAQIGAGNAPALVDVRDPKLFHPRHLPGSQNAPDSQTTALIKKLQTLPRAILICDDGKLSAVVCRTLGFCKITSVSYLDGGINAWAAAGGKLAETTRSGFEHEIQPLPKDPDDQAGTPITKRWMKSITGFFKDDDEEEAK